jgi:hypothetical protein
LDFILETSENMHTKKIWMMILLSLSLIMAGCVPETPTETPDIAGTAAAMAETIVAVQLTKIAEEATSTLTPTPEPTDTPTPTLTYSLPTPFPTQPAASEGQPCLGASMIRETIPDFTTLEPGQSFDKTWTLQNTGSCAWTTEFSVVFHHGETLGAPQQISFPGSVQPGEAFDLTVPMVAPAAPGEHLSYWTLMAPDGSTFGTNSSALFWAWIKVADVIPPDSLFDIWIPNSTGGVLETGSINTNVVVGDSQFDYGWQGFMSVNLNNIPAGATITAVYLLFEGNSVVGSPFSNLGCMGVYRYNYGNLDPSDYYNDTPGGALWSFCSAGEVQAGVSRYGGDAAISAIQNSIGGTIQFRFQFNTESDKNSTDDIVTLFPVIRIEYTTP